MTTQFEDRLLTALLDEYETLTLPDTPPAVAPYAPRMRSLSVISAGLVAAATVAVVLLSGGGRTAAVPGHPARTATAHVPVAGSPPVAQHVDVRFVVHRMETALSANTDVLHELVHAPDSQTGAPTIQETWARGGTDTSRSITLNPQGQPVSGVLMTISPHQTTTVTIDYAARTYAQHTYPFGCDQTGPAPAPATPTGQAGALRDAVSAGRVTLVGPATIDGQQTLQLRDTRSQYGTIELWVDPSSYLPVQEIDIPTGQTANSVQSIQTRFEWLPATQANLAELTPAGAIPAGFQPATGD